MIAESIIFLQEFISSANVLREHECTPLHKAALKGHAEVTTILIQNGATVNAADTEECTPLHKAALKGHSEVTTILIQNGATVNAADTEGNTPLHCAGSGNIVDVLIKKGADIKYTNANGDTPLHCARSDEIANVLIKNGADINSTNTKVGKYASARSSRIWSYTSTSLSCRASVGVGFDLSLALTFPLCDVLANMSIGGFALSTLSLFPSLPFLCAIALLLDVFAGKTPYNLAKIAHRRNKGSYYSDDFKLVSEYLEKQKNTLSKSGKQSNVTTKKDTSKVSNKKQPREKNGYLNDNKDCELAKFYRRGIWFRPDPAVFVIDEKKVISQQGKNSHCGERVDSDTDEADTDDKKEQTTVKQTDSQSTLQALSSKLSTFSFQFNAAKPSDQAESRNEQHVHVFSETSEQSENNPKTKKAKKNSKKSS
ncbi:unnamed protein product [Mytilus coruscus]|uniref:Uncharacterized protein n=1 Tax=Mytilus coruscus TaxID=42192 RepID=A0A6J8CTP3_MYTCO|nr:unnamed protein product [Mytilus coruscus]